MNRVKSLNQGTASHVQAMRQFICGAGLIACVILLLSVFADGQTAPSKDAVRAPDAKVAPAVQEEPSAEDDAASGDGAADEKKAKKKSGMQRRRAEVLDFVQEHFPELGTVLAQAEKNHPTKIKNAYYRINKEVVRLEKLKTARPEKFELALKQWKLKTRIEIAVAQFAKKENAEQLKTRIEPLVVELAANRRKMLDVERAFIVERLSRIDRLIERYESRPDASVKSNLKTYEESASKIRNAKKKTKSIFQGVPSSSDADQSVAPVANP